MKTPENQTPIDQSPDHILEYRADIDTEAVLGSIMTAKEYSKVEHPTPYVFKLKVGDTELCYFGAPHVRDSHNSLFGEIEKAFNDANPDIVFVEGINSTNYDRTEFNNRILSATTDEIINAMGESGFTLRLALEKGIDWKSPEPADANLYEYLLSQGFSKDHIFAWNVLHILPQYNNQTNRKGFKKYVAGFMNRFERDTKWQDFDYSYERAIKIGEEICGESIDVEHDMRALDRIDPIPREEMLAEQTVLNRISEASSILRDRHIVKEIIDATKTHKRLFVVYGASHAVMQEPALKKAFDQTT